MAGWLWWGRGHGEKWANFNHLLLEKLGKYTDLYLIAYIFSVLLLLYGYDDSIASPQLLWNHVMIV